MGGYNSADTALRDSRSLDKIILLAQNEQCHCMHWVAEQARAEAVKQTYCSDSYLLKPSEKPKVKKAEMFKSRRTSSEICGLGSALGFV